MTPIETQVAILPDKADAEKDGFFLADNSQKPPKAGTVIAVGPGTYARDTGKHIPMQIKEGDHVRYSAYGGTDIEYEGETVVILQQAQILIID